LKLVTSEYLEHLGIPWCFREDADKLAQTGKAFIINLDDKHNQGSHWVAARLVYMPHMLTPILYYADPFGTFLNGWPPQELEDYDFIANRITFQRPESYFCGYYAIQFVNALDNITKPITQKEFESALWQSIK
jgi:hypothetical protein